MSNKMNELQAQKGKPLRELIIEYWDKHGTQQGIADELGVSQGTISLWMFRLGLTFKTIIVDARETA
jgi:hypothetical protein